MKSDDFLNNLIFEKETEKDSRNTHDKKTDSWLKNAKLFNEKKFKYHFVNTPTAITSRSHNFFCVDSLAF